ncbi:MAG TPA: tetratricopeptide repeat protein [Myxococcales bacterium]|nr:tetratricopeptide repeat protein [Myxococcales bacterium]
MVATLVVALALGTGSGITQARDLAKRSMIEYDAGDFEKALNDAQRAYELDPLPALLFNLGQCHRALHHWERAEFYYRGYLRRRPDAKNRAAVEGLIADMQARQKEATAAASTPAAAPILVEAPAAAPSPPPPAAVPTTSAPEAAVTAPAPGRPVPVGAWVVGSVGVAAVAAGVVFAVLATDLKNSDSFQNGSAPTAFHTISQGQFNDETTDAYFANGLIYGGAVALVGGVLWGVFGRGSAPASGPAAVSF